MTPKPHDQDKLTELEGRVIAHRKLLALLVAGMPQQQKEDLLEWLADRAVLRDGQEDPGAVPTGVEALSLSISDEFRQIAEIARRRRP